MRKPELTVLLCLDTIRKLTLSQVWNSKDPINKGKKKVVMKKISINKKMIDS